MEAVTYLNEHLLPGQLGHISILLAFVAGLLAAVSYGFATRRSGTEGAVSWKKIGRWAFAVHGLGVFGVIGMLFFVMINKYYEYYYVMEHVSEDLSMRYVFSAFWEGQEGSFLLWMFWHVVLGAVLLFTAKRWESPVMLGLSLVQVFLGSMILGVYITESVKIGINPTVLLRDMSEAPLFQQQDYVSQLPQFAKGLNPLLQNYWMTIHPPTLFLGFASTTIPFCFALGGLMTGRHKEWLRPALPWALFSGAILGTGILMGGAWAYEALSFGGYWAWDPVENMSLVPWLVLIAGIHTNLVARNTGHSIRSTYFYYLLTFVLILYSTFLTRSGVLGESSVHAFTEMGLEWQLVAFIGFFTLLSAYFFARRFKAVPAPVKEEATPSREFWMFIGALVLLFSAILITASTSLPVYNKIRQFFQPAFEGSTITEPVEHYNKYQLWIAVFIALLSGATQFLRYRARNWAQHRRLFLRQMAVAGGLTAALTILLSLWIETKAWQYAVLLVAASYSVVANLQYLLPTTKGNLKLAGSAVSHLGFGLMLIGVLASGLNKQHLSSNPMAQRGLLDEDMLGKNVLLFKEQPLFMKGYEATYVRDTFIGLKREYEIRFRKIDEQGEVEETFNTKPYVLYSREGDNITPNPSTKRYLERDIFTYIATLPQVEVDPEYARQVEDSLDYRTYSVLPRDTAGAAGYVFRLDEWTIRPRHEEYQAELNDLALGAVISVWAAEEPGVVRQVQPVLVLRENLLYQFPDRIQEWGLKFRLPKESLEQYFTIDEDLQYSSFEIKKEEQIEFEDFRIAFQGFNRSPEHPNYAPKESDIAVSAVLEVKQQNNPESYFTEPLFLIRGKELLNIKTVLDDLGLHFRFVNIDPATDSITLLIAKDPKHDKAVAFQVASDVPRNDFIVLEVIEFPGINLFWLGSIFLMLGMCISLFRRLRA